MDPVTLSALISAGGSLASSQSGASASAGSAKADRERKEEEFRRRKQAYDQMIQRSQGLASSGEQSFLQETANPLAELGEAKQGALTGNAAALQQGAGQMQANLVQSGVRGGQAATLLNRGTGQQSVDANQMINQMAMDEATQRRQMRGGLFGQKAGAGYSGQLQQFGG
jgi:hypothetical protein